MTDYFADSSALVKRYVTEAGSDWLRSVCSDPNHTIILSEVTLAEVAAAFAGARRSGRIRPEECAGNLDLLIRDAANAYELLPVRRSVVDLAVELTQRHRLCGYDAVQLASALEVDRLLKDDSSAELVFLSADADLLGAAALEGVSAENPNAH